MSLNETTENSYVKLPDKLGPYENDPASREAYGIPADPGDYKRIVQKPNLLPVIMLGLIVLISFGIGFALMMFGTKYLPESLKKLAGITETKKTAPLKGPVKVVFVDKKYKVYNGYEDQWVPHTEKSVPLDTAIRTGYSSHRNVFALNDNHTIRVDNDSTFQVDSYMAPNRGDVDLKDEKKKTALVKGGSSNSSPKRPAEVEITLDRGNLWVEPGSDNFTINTANAKVTSHGKDFQVQTLDDGKIAVYAWQGPVTVTTVNGTQKTRNLARKQILYVNAKGGASTSSITKKDRWQTWNRKTDNKTIQAEEIPEMPPFEIPGVKVNNNNRAKPSPRYTPNYVYHKPSPRYTPSYTYRRPSSTRTRRGLPTIGNSDSYPKASPGRAYPTYSPRRRSSSKKRSYLRRNSGKKKSTRYVRPTRTRKTPSYRPSIKPAPRNTNNNLKPRTNPLYNPTPSRPSPLNNNPTLKKVPGMGLNDKPVGPSGGYGVPSYPTNPTD